MIDRIIRTPWIEVDCPNGMGDFDVEPVGSMDDLWRCPGCGQEHRLGDIGQVAIPRGGELIWLQRWQLGADGMPTEADINGD